MKPSDEFAVIVAGVVSANTFQLLNAAGAVVAELGSTTIGVSPAAALFMRHLDATVVDSSLAWTQSAFAGFQSVQITGPKTIAGTTTPLIRLSSVGASSNALMQTAGPLAVTAQVDSSTGFSLTDQNRNNGVLSNYPGWNNYGAVSDNGTDVYYHRLSSSHSRIGHGDFSGGGGSFVEKAYVGVNGVTAAVIGENEAIMRSNLGTGEYVQATGGNINIKPAAGGRVNLGLRGAYLPLGGQQLNLPASLAPMPAFAAFILNGIAINGVAGDQITITLSARIVCAAAAGAAILQPQIFGPTGNVVLPQRLVATQWAVNHDASLSMTWVYTLALGTGVHVVTIIGGQTGGAWWLINPDTMFTVNHIGIR